MIGCEAKARTLTDSSRPDSRRCARAAPFARRPRVYFEEWDGPLISGIRWVSELVTLAGGEDCSRARAQSLGGPHHRRSARGAAART
jgi:iron complex transport system substrate-binding protein